MYFEQPGKVNTTQTVEAAMKIARERGIRHIVVASVRGETAMLLTGFSGQVICVTHVNGFSENGQNEMTDAMRERIVQAGVKVLTGTHVLSGVERGMSSQFKGTYPAEIIAHSLRMMGQGTKVCVEVAVMALDAGLIPYDEKIVAIGGTGLGVDTALIMTPAHASQIFQTRIHEVICKPSFA